MIKNDTMETKKRVMIFCIMLRPINENMDLILHHGDTQGTEKGIFSFAGLRLSEAQARGGDAGK